jgi:hypothetical protein
MKFIIIIAMMFPYPLAYWESNALRIIHRDGITVEFDTAVDCYRYVRANVRELSLFAFRTFSDKPGARIESIRCIPVGELSI